MAREPLFIHLHTHSSYSLLEGALTLGKLIDLAKADKQPALALTDTGNLFGALEFSEKAASYGVQPIIGSALAIDFGDVKPNGRDEAAALPRLVLLAADAEGYANLMRLVSRSFMESPDGEAARIALPWLSEAGKGLIALSGGPSGPLDKALGAGMADIAEARLGALKEVFGDRLYVELQRLSVAGEKRREAGLVALAYRHGLPLVATNEPYFATAADHEAHDALFCIAEGALVADGERRQASPEQRFKTRAEMNALFADLPEAIQSTVEIARRVSYRPATRKPILPRFTDGDGGPEAEAAELRRQAEAGLKRRLEAQPPAPGVSLEDYKQRLDYEIGVIERMKYSGYFLIVADFIQWAKAQQIPVGPGRGSGAGSLVAYALTITDLDPLRFQLFFERFLNPERVSMPDFDVDFCQNRRDEVIAYVQQRYGREQVAQIITFGTLQARGVLRDVGRVLQMPFGQVSTLCTMVPQNPANPVTLAQAIEGEPRLQAAIEAEPVVKRAFEIARKLEGLHRHASTHAAGIVIGDRPLAELVPLYRDPKSGMPVTQFNMKWVEQAGLVKFDFLGLKTLTVLQTTVDLLAKRGIAVDAGHLPLDDPEPFEMLARGETVGVFQVESAGMRRALVDMRPDRFEDLIALVALYRPGPMANIPTYCARKLGRETTTYLHPKLEPILEPTYGVITYQEQVMQIARDLAGYSFGEADLLRRAMGKKIRAEMEKQRERFLTGATERGIAQRDAEAIFEACAKFADYGFNKSHSAPYALITYQTAYLKAKYPAEFLAASMQLDLSNTDKLSEFRQEARRLGIDVVPPCINRSAAAFTVEDGRILYALGAVKGVGEQAAAGIVAARGSRPFRDLSDFARRLPPKLLNKRTLESLVAAGAFDALEPDRARLFTGLDRVLGEAQRAQESVATGQNELFGGEAARGIVLPEAEPWLPAERLKREHEAVGFFLTGHPLDDYAGVVTRLKADNWMSLQKKVKDGASAGRLAAMVVSRLERRTKSGSKMGVIGFSDPTGHYEAVIFSEGLGEYRDLLQPGKAVSILVQAELQGDEVRVRIQAAEPLDAAAARHQRGLRIFLRDEAPLDSIARRLGSRGDSEVNVVLVLGGSEVEIRLPGRYAVSPQIAGAVKAIPGVITVQDL